MTAVNSNYNRVSKRIFTIFLIILMMTPYALAKDVPLNLPARSLEMAVEYPGVVIPPEENVSMDVIFHNQGRSNEDVDLWLSDIPSGWNAKIKTYQYSITAVHVPSNEDKTVTFEAEPKPESGKNVNEGEYIFTINAQTKDGWFKTKKQVKVTVKKSIDNEKKDKGVKLTTSYPVLRGPSDGKFEFSIEVASKLDKDAVFDLFAQGPTDWEVNFKPAYETKYISSLRIKSDQSQTVAVEVKPASNAKSGEYPVNVKVTTSDAKGEAKLMVVLTGTYKLEAGTPNDLLSLETRQGKPSNMSLYVKNTGTATNHDISFMSFKPENWNVEFKPEKIDKIEPGEFEQVEITITSYEEAIVGDYSIGVKVNGEKASKDIEFRATVKASSTWGWIGIGIIILVIGGLIGLFRWLGRR